MIFALPIVLGAIALTCTILTTIESPHLQGLTNAAISGVGSVSVTVYATRTLLDCLRPTNSRNAPSARTLFRHFSRWAAAAVPSISNVVDELAPYSGPLSSAAANILSASPAFASYVHTFSVKVTSVETKARVWFGPRNQTLNLDLWFGWQPVYEGVGLAFCGDHGLYFPSTRLCYRIARASHVVRSLNVYRSDTKALVVYGQMPPALVCLPGDPPYYHPPMPVYGQGRQALATMNRIISIQPSLPIPLSHSGSGAVVSLDVYQPEMKALAVYNLAPLRRCVYAELLRAWFGALSTLAGMYRWVTMISTYLYPSRAGFGFACALAFVGVCTRAIAMLRYRNLTNTKTTVSSVLTPTQQLYLLVLINPDGSQPEESNWWSLVPRFSSKAPYGQHDRDQGPEDDVSQMPASDSHGVLACLVTSDHQIGSVASAFGASDVDLTAPSRSGNCDGNLSEGSARSTTCASCDEDATVNSRVIDTSGPTLTGNVDVNTPADTSSSSEALIGSGDATQEPPTDELARADPKEGEDVDRDLATSLDESTRCDTNSPSAPTLESDPAQLSSPSQVVAPTPADNTQCDIGLDVSVDMSLETDAGNQDTPLGTPKADGDGTDTSAGNEIDHTSTAPDSSNLLLLPSISSSEMIADERAEAFFADMTTDSFVGSREGLSTTTEEDSDQVAPTAVKLLAEESLDLTTNTSLGSQLLDVDLAALGDSMNSLDSDGPAARKVEPIDWADDGDSELPEPMYGPPLSASTHAPASASALATITKKNPSEDRPERLRTTGLETSSRQKRPTLMPNGLLKLLVSNNVHNAARSGPAPPFVAASPSLPLFSSPSSSAPSLSIPSVSYVATSHGQDERKVGDLSMETSQKRTTRNQLASGQQAARKAPVEGSSKSMWAPVGEDATGEGATGEDVTGEGAAGQDDIGQDDVGQDAAGEDAAGEDAAGQDAVGQDTANQDAAGEGVGETAEPRTGQRRSPSNKLGRMLRGKARQTLKLLRQLPFFESE
ncbi:hypothetical protein FRC12_005124 [Ceratobasidium sp. 428]|nr:hypothetical protein FRC12_005124 [Ceratobasidium sp. 428]